MILNQLKDKPVLAIIRHKEDFDVESLMHCLYDSGIPTAEITMNTPNAPKLIDRAHKSLGNNMSIGAGTVLDIDDLHCAIDHGASFIVTPVLNIQVIEEAVKKNIPIFPGAFTPTEVFEAHQAGAAMVKVFPAATVGPNYFKYLKGPMANLRLMAVGGVDASNVNEYLNNGADAVAIGAGVIKPSLVSDNDYAVISRNVKKFLENISV